MKNVKIGTIVRLIVMILSMVNMLLTVNGKNPLPWSEDEMYMGLSQVAAILTTVWTWWKNNSFTKEAIKADEYLEDLRNGNNQLHN
ncbi:MAG: phage holin [Oscillospiraceae bacterium]|nr:phage holin [Oscillospiraceae bacterium]